MVYRLRQKQQKAHPRHSQIGHTWHKSALSHLFSDHPRQSIRPARKTASEAKCVKSKTAPRTSQKLQLRHKQKSVYPRADVAQFTVAFYRQFGRNRPRCQNDQTRSPSTHLLSSGYRYRRNESEETKEAQAHQPAVMKMKFRDPGNRVSQAIFRCLSCGHQTNADINAAENIRHQGLEILAKAENSTRRTAGDPSGQQAHHNPSHDGPALSARTRSPSGVAKFPKHDNLPLC